jgi:hypothetical protein
MLNDTPYQNIEKEFPRVIDAISFPEGITLKLENGMLIGDIAKFPEAPGLNYTPTGIIHKFENGDIVGNKETTFYIDNFLFNLAQEDNLEGFIRHIQVCLLNLAMSIKYITNLECPKIGDEPATFQVEPQGEQVNISLSAKSGIIQHLGHVTYKVVKEQ